MASTTAGLQWCSQQTSSSQLSPLPKTERLFTTKISTLNPQIFKQLRSDVPSQIFFLPLTLVSISRHSLQSPSLDQHTTSESSQESDRICFEQWQVYSRSAPVRACLMHFSLCCGTFTLSQFTAQLMKSTKTISSHWWYHTNAYKDRSPQCTRLV